MVKGILRFFGFVATVVGSLVLVMALPTAAMISSWNSENQTLTTVLIVLAGAEILVGLALVGYTIFAPVPTKVERKVRHRHSWKE